MSCSSVPAGPHTSIFSKTLFYWRLFVVFTVKSSLRCLLKWLEPPLDHLSLGTARQTAPEASSKTLISLQILNINVGFRPEKQSTSPLETNAAPWNLNLCHKNPNVHILWTSFKGLWIFNCVLLLYEIPVWMEVFLFLLFYRLLLFYTRLWYACSCSITLLLTSHTHVMFCRNSPDPAQTGWSASAEEQRRRSQTEHQTGSRWAAVTRKRRGLHTNDLLTSHMTLGNTPTLIKKGEFYRMGFIWDRSKTKVCLLVMFKLKCFRDKTRQRLNNAPAGGGDPEMLEEEPRECELLSCALRWVQVFWATAPRTLWDGM